MTFLRLFAISLTFVLSSSFLFPSTITLSLEDNGDLNYVSDTDLYGFQFNHDGCAVDSGGGDATANGFAVSASSSTAIGFSFSS